MQLTVSIVEDDRELRLSLSELIRKTSEYQLVSEHESGESAMAEIPRFKPDVVLMDINLPGIDGIECVKRLKEMLPATQVIMLTVFEDGDRLFKSLQAGASGYLLKRTAPERLMDAVLEAHEGGSPITPLMARRIVRHFREISLPTDNELGELTTREMNVLDQLSQGLMYKEITAKLGISMDTVRSYIRNIYRKLHVHSRTEAVVKYLRHKS